MARVCAQWQGVQRKKRQEGQATDTHTTKRGKGVRKKKNETRETIPILIIHNLVRQFQSSFVLFLLHFFSLVHVQCARTHRVMNRAEQPRSEEIYAVHFTLFALT